MKKSLMILFAGLITLFTITAVFSSCSGTKSPGSDKDMVLWYLKPGEKWLDGLPIGNGYMGAMVFGKVQNERIALNESSFWSGRPHDYDDPDAFKYFAKIKDLVFAEKFQEAEKMANEHFWGIPKAQQFYQPLGDLLLNFKGGGKVKDYYRELDMETGIVKITYTDGNTKFTREAFMSYPDHVLVVKISSDKPGRVSVEAKLKSPFLDQTIAKDGKLLINGTWRYLSTRIDGLMAKVEGTGLKFQTALIAIPEKGKLVTSDSSLVINNANSVTFVLTAATNYVNFADIIGDPAARCDKVLAAISNKDFNALRTTHENDFRGLMGRVHLTIGDQLMNQKPTDERLNLVRQGLERRNFATMGKQIYDEYQLSDELLACRSYKP